MIAHIGNIPVQESLPFLVPIIALALSVWRKERRRREELERLPGAEELLDARTVELVLERWAESQHEDLGARHIPILYPPGPDNTTAEQLAGRANCDTDTIQQLLAELEEFGYVDLEGYDGPDLAVSLTVEGYDLVNMTEAVLLRAAAAIRRS